MHRRVPRLLTCTIAACAPVLGLVIAVAPGASAATTSSSSSSASTHAQALAAARAAIRHLTVGQHLADGAASGGSGPAWPGAAVNVTLVPLEGVAMKGTIPPLPTRTDA